ncbi:MAG TPA: aspartate:alanine exchanger family transporter [Anaerolineaceae bacterium]
MEVDGVISLLAGNPLLLLFLIAAAGYPLGRLRIAGASLGVAAVLFVGLAASALHPSLKLPEIIQQIGLVLFVYTIGLSSGAVFFTSFRKHGLKFNLLAIGGLIAAFITAAGISAALQIKPTFTAGLFSGSLTNTPALAALIEYIKSIQPVNPDTALSEPIIGYSLAYPLGVIIPILTIIIVSRIFKVDYQSESQQQSEFNLQNDPLYTRTLLVTRPNSQTVAEMMRHEHWNVIFGRIKSGDTLDLVSGKTVLRPGDIVSLIGSANGLEEVTARLGEVSPIHLEQDLKKYDKRRIFVSNPEIGGRRLKDILLFNRFGGIITRVRRGDIEMLPHGDTVLNLGDVVRVVAPHEQMNAISHFLGDSYRAVSEVDILTFGLGLALGLVVGQIPLPLPGGITLRLGIAGGPLIVSLLLGALGRTGPLLWNLPYSTNLTLRQIGLVLFLATIGTRAGDSFIFTLKTGGGFMLLGGAVITIMISVVILVIGYRFLHIPMGVLAGILAGVQTQPAVLSFALEDAKNDQPNYGYLAVYPLAMIAKIILVQGLFILLS